MLEPVGRRLEISRSTEEHRIAVGPDAEVCGVLFLPVLMPQLLVSGGDGSCSTD